MRTQQKVRILGILAILVLVAIPVAYGYFGIKVLVPLLTVAMLLIWYAQDLKRRARVTALKSLRDAFLEEKRPEAFERIDR